MSEASQSSDAENLRDEHARALKRLAMDSGQLGGLAQKLLDEQEDDDEY